MATVAITTGAQFDALPYEEGRLWELIDGELIPVSSPTAEHQIVIQQLLLAFMLHFRAAPEQGLLLQHVEFALAENFRVRPDVLVLLPEAAKRLDRKKVPVPGSPDLAIEVISASERTSDSREKVDAYLHYGASEVWQVFPKLQEVVVYRGAKTITVASHEVLTTPLLPGFSLPLNSLF